MKLKSLLIILALTNIYPAIAQEKWEKNQIGSHNGINNLVIADGRNDGIQRIYGASFDGYIFEWTYNSGTSDWTKLQCAQITEDPVGYGPIFYGLQAGYGQNDGKIRLYAVNGNGLSYEVYYKNSSNNWEVKKLDNGGIYQPQGILVGDTRNDGTNRLITCGLTYDNGASSLKVHEYTWNSSSNSYDFNYVKDQYMFLFHGAMGNARNDGKNYIYLPESHDFGQTVIREYKWTGSNYQENSIPLQYPAQRLAIGVARNDNKQRIYVSDGFYSPGKAYLRELSYQNNSWQENIIHSASFPERARFELAIGAARINDGKKRLYSVARNGNLVEHSFENSKWENNKIDAVSGATATIEIGNARNDNINRIYISGKSGRLYEYTHQGTTNISKNNTTDNFKIFPNPCTETTQLDFTLKKDKDLHVQLYSINGRLVEIKNFNNLKAGANTLEYNCSGIPGGTYIIKLISNKKTIGSNKLIIK